MRTATLTGMVMGMRMITPAIMIMITSRTVMAATAPTAITTFAPPSCT
jgi:hypothetical protein